MRAVIPVAGVGSRLRPHTYTTPKVLLNVAGKPILAHILDALLEQNITKATIITGYMGNLVEEFATSKYPDINFDFVVQQKMLGLGHAIWTGRETFGSDPLMIILGDTVFDVDLGKAVDSEYNSLGVKYVEDPSRFGVALLDDDGKITKLVEKPSTLISNLALVGIYYIKDSDKLTKALNKLIDEDIKTRGEYQLTDALQLMIDAGSAFNTFNVAGWYDCGKRETLLSTNRFLLDKKSSPRSFSDSIIIEPCFIADDAIIERSIIGPYASIGAGANVQDSIVRDSIISYGAIVHSSLLNKSIIGNDAAVIGKFQKLNVGNSSQIDNS